MKIIYYMNIILYALYATRNGLNTISNRKKKKRTQHPFLLGIFTDNLLFRIERRLNAWHILLQSQMCLSQAAHCIRLWCIYHGEYLAWVSLRRIPPIPSVVCLDRSILEHASYCHTSFTKNKARGFIPAPFIN